MAQTKLGGLKAARTTKRKHGRNFYRKIGAIGGKVGRTGGFYHMMITGQTEKLRQISREAGRNQKRGPAKEKAW